MKTRAALSFPRGEGMVAAARAAQRDGGKVVQNNNKMRTLGTMAKGERMDGHAAQTRRESQTKGISNQTLAHIAFHFFIITMMNNINLTNKETKKSPNLNGR